MDAFDDLALIPGLAGDAERARQLDPPLPFESPDQTAARQASVQKQAQADFTGIQRFKAGDFARRGIPAFTDFNTGATTPFTDATGAPVTQYDAKNNIGWDSSGQPVKPGFDEAGQPKLSDPFAGLEPITDQKTGYKYKIAGGLPWQNAGQDQDIAATNLQKDQDRAVAQASSALGRKLTMAERQTHLDAAEFHHRDKAFASNFGPIDYDNPDAARATLEKQFDEQYRAPEASKTGWFDSKLTPEAQQMRAGIDAQKAKALTTFDALVQKKQALDQAREASNQIVAKRMAYEQFQSNAAEAALRKTGAVIPGLDDAAPESPDAPSLPAKSGQALSRTPVGATGAGDSAGGPSAPQSADSQVAAVAPSPSSSVIPGLTEAQKKSDEVDRAQVAAALPPAAQQVAEPAKTNAKGEVQPEGFWATVGRAFGSKIIPAVATAGGGIASGLGAAAITSFTGPGAVAAGIAADVAGGAASGLAVNKLQRSVMGDQWAEENDAQMEANARAHPVAAQIGTIVPFLVSLFGGGGGAAVKVGEKVIGKATTAIGREAIKDALATGARYEAPMLERIASHAVMGARAGASEGAQEKYAEGKDVSVLDDTAKRAVQFGALGLFPPAKALLTQIFGTAVTSAAAMTFAGHLYDSAIHGKEFNLEDVSKEFAGDIPAFVIQNALLGFLSRGMSAMNRPGESIKLSNGIPEGTPPDVGEELAGLRKTDPEKFKQRRAEEILKRQKAEYPVDPPTAKEWMNAVDVRLAQMRGQEGIDHSEEADGLQKVKDGLSKTPGGEEPPAPEAPITPAPTKPTTPSAPAAKAAAPNDDLLAERADLQQKVSRTPQSATDAALLTAEKARLANVERELAATLPNPPETSSGKPPIEPVTPATPSLPPRPPGWTHDGDPSTPPASPTESTPVAPAGQAEPAPDEAVMRARESRRIAQQVITSGLRADGKEASPLDIKTAQEAVTAAGAIIAQNPGLKSKLPPPPKRGAASGQAPVASSEATLQTGQTPTSRTSDSAVAEEVNQPPSSESQQGTDVPAQGSERAPSVQREVRQESVPSTVDTAAHEAATSPQNELTATPAQIEGNNAKLGHVNVGGLDVSIEHPAGTARKEGWQPLKGAHYGYLKATTSGDGEHMDAFVKEGTPTDYSGPVYVVNRHPAGGVSQFTTSKGSVYTVHSDGTTTRDKSVHPEHPGDQGIKKRSSTTFYVTPENAVALAEIQTQGGDRRDVRMVDRYRAGMHYMEGSGKGKFERRTVVPVERTPKVGLQPVELWEGSSHPHFGNPITSVRPRGIDHKVIIGADSAEDALKIHNENYPAGLAAKPEDVATFSSTDSFKKWATGATRRTAAAKGDAPTHRFLEQGETIRVNDEVPDGWKKGQWEKVPKQHAGKKNDGSRTIRRTVEPEAKPPSPEATIPGLGTPKEDPALTKLREKHRDVLSELQAAQDAQKSGFGDEDTDEEIASLTRVEKKLREQIESRPPEAASPEPPRDTSALKQRIATALQPHHEALAKLGHPAAVEFGETHNASGIETDTETQRIRVNPEKLQASLDGFENEPKASEWLRRAMAHEVIHVATLKYASETPANRAKLLKLAKDADLMGRAAEAYGKEWESLNDFAKAAEAARMLIEGPDELTEASYSFLKDFLEWLQQKLRTLDKATREVVMGIREKMGRHEKAQGVAKPDPAEKPATAKQAKPPATGLPGDLDPRISEETQRAKDHLAALLGGLGASKPTWKPPVRGAAPAPPAAPAILTPAQSDLLKSTYRTLVARTGFPAVMISDLAKQTGIPLGKLKEQLAAERLKGNIVLSTGDWSLATEEQRAGVMDVPAVGRALQVRYLPQALGAAAPNKQTETPEFKRWFGASKAVDSKGEPEMLYTGQPRGITELPESKRSELPLAHAFLTDDREVAGKYSGAGERDGSTDFSTGRKGRTYRVFASIKKPVNLDEPLNVGEWKKRLAPPDDVQARTATILESYSEEKLAEAAKTYGVTTVDEDGDAISHSHLARLVAEKAAANPKSGARKSAEREALAAALGLEENWISGYDDEPDQKQGYVLHDGMAEDYFPDNFDIGDVMLAKWAAINGQGYYLQDALNDSPTGQAFALFPEIGEAIAKEGGHDGYVHTDTESGGKTWIPFSAEQVKSATGNRGTFDPEDANMLGAAAPNERNLNPPQAEALLSLAKLFVRDMEASGKDTTPEDLVRFLGSGPNAAALKPFTQRLWRAIGTFVQDEEGWNPKQDWPAIARKVQAEKPVIPGIDPAKSKALPKEVTDAAPAPQIEQISAAQAEAKAAERLAGAPDTSPAKLKVQKAFLLDALDKAIEQAEVDRTPDFATDEGRKDAEEVAAFNRYDSPMQKEKPNLRHSAFSDEQKAEHAGKMKVWEARATVELGRLFNEYGIAEPRESLPGILAAEPSSFDERVNQLSAAIHTRDAGFHPKIEIEVPGDGVFRIVNTKQALKEFRKTAEKEFPTTGANPDRGPSSPRITPTAIPPLGKPKLAKDFVKIAGIAASTDSTRYVINYVLYDGDTLVGTDGRRLLAIEGKLEGVKVGKRPPGVLSMAGTVLLNPKTMEQPKEEMNFPNWRQTIPGGLKHAIKALDTATLAKMVIQAQEMAGEPGNGDSLALWLDDQGKLGVTSNTPELGEYAGGEVDPQTAKFVMSLKPGFLLDGLRAARALGHEKVNLRWQDGMSPMMLEAPGMKYVLMPMRNTGSRSNVVNGGRHPLYEEPKKQPAARIRDDSPEAGPILAQIDAISAKAAKRRSVADPAIRGMRPTDEDWLTDEEKKQVHDLQSQLRPKSQQEAKSDVKTKRAAALGAAGPANSSAPGGPVEVGHALLDPDTPIVTDLADIKGYPDAESSVLVDKAGVHHYDLTGEKPALMATSRATGDQPAIDALTDAAIPKVRNLDEIDRDDFPDATKALLIRPNTGRLELVDIASEEPIAEARLGVANDSNVSSTVANDHQSTGREPESQSSSSIQSEGNEGDAGKGRVVDPGPRNERVSAAWDDSGAGSAGGLDNEGRALAEVRDVIRKFHETPRGKWREKRADEPHGIAWMDPSNGEVVYDVEDLTTYRRDLGTLGQRWMDGVLEEENDHQTDYIVTAAREGRYGAFQRAVWKQAPTAVKEALGKVYRHDPLGGGDVGNGAELIRMLRQLSDGRQISETILPFWEEAAETMTKALKEWDLPSEITRHLAAMARVKHGKIESVEALGAASPSNARAAAERAEASAAGRASNRADTKTARDIATRPAGNILKSAIGRVKAVADFAVKQLTEPPHWTSFDKLAGEWQGAGNPDTIGSTGRQVIDHEARQLMKAMQKELPNPLSDMAALRFIDAKGDEAIMREQMAKSKPAVAKLYERALALDPAEKAAVENAREYYAAEGQRMLNHGMLKELLTDYVSRLIDRSTIPVVQAEGLKTSFAAQFANDFPPSKLRTKLDHAIRRTHEFIFDLEQKGIGMKTQRLSEAMAAYSQAVGRVIVDRTFVKGLPGIKATDGRPGAALSGYAKSVDGDEKSAGALLVKPNTKGKKFNDAGEVTADYSDYIPGDHPALRGYKFMGSDADGKPTLLEADMLIHPEFAQRLKNMLGTSALNRIPSIRAITNAQGIAKQVMLGWSIFHPIQTATHFAGSRIAPVGMRAIDVNDPLTRALLNHGMNLFHFEAAQHFGEGLAASGLGKYLGPLGRINDLLTGWTFEQFIPRLINEAGHKYYAQNKKRYAKELADGKITEDQILFMSARSASEAGGFGNERFEGKNPTVAHAERLVFLAPRFLKDRIKWVGRAFTKYGVEERHALILLALGLGIAAKLIERMITGKNDWTKPFTVVTQHREYEMRSVPGDIISMFESPRRFINGRLSPLISRPILEELTGRDYRGRKRTQGEQLMDLLKTPIPIMARGLVDKDAPELSPLEQTGNALGFRARRHSDITNARILGHEWQKKQGVQNADEVYPPSKYLALRQALEDDNMPKAREAYSALVAGGDKKKIDRGFHESLMKPFSGADKTEPKFLASLSENERATYRAATAQRNQVNRLFTTLSGYHPAPKLPAFQGFGN